MTATKVQFKYESASAYLNVWEGGTTASLNSLYSEEPRLGHATQLMKLICEYADSKDVILVLMVGQYGDQHSMNNKQLTQFYSKFGFVVLNGSPRSKPTMQRDPIS